MAEIQCPHCGKSFTVDESQYANIVKQVRDKEFEKELAERLHLVEQKNASALDATVAKTREESRDELESLRQQLAQAQQKAAVQEAQLRQAAQAKEQELTQAAQAKEMELRQKAQELQAKLERQANERQAQDQTTIASLTAKLEEAEHSFQVQKELAVQKAVGDKDVQITTLKSQVAAAEIEKKQVEASLKQQLSEKTAYKDQVIRDKEDEIERLRNQRSRLSVKLIGETLEQHCEMEFNRVRMMAFPHAEFHKDNQVVDGTKGDYVFREMDESGVEIVSIMFDMKNEDDNSVNRKKNEDHLKKLDKDRRDKGCEYAVLVSTLEPESELYNSGIVDVSYLYPKTYVIRPQFFLPLISLLRNAGLNAVSARQELATMRQQNIDVTHFEEKFNKFKTGFLNNCELAGKRYDDAIDEIDKSIDHLEKVKDALIKSKKYLFFANNKVDEMTIHKLTYANPTMKALFAEARKENQTEKETPDE